MSSYQDHTICIALRVQICPKIERDFPYTTWGPGFFRPSILRIFREASGFLGLVSHTSSNFEYYTRYMIHIYIQYWYCSSIPHWYMHVHIHIYIYLWICLFIQIYVYISYTVYKCIELYIIFSYTIHTKLLRIPSLCPKKVPVCRNSLLLLQGQDWRSPIFLWKHFLGVIPPGWKRIKNNNNNNSTSLCAPMFAVDFSCKILLWS